MFYDRPEKRKPAPTGQKKPPLRAGSGSRKKPPLRTGSSRRKKPPVKKPLRQSAPLSRQKPRKKRHLPGKLILLLLLLTLAAGALLYALPVKSLGSFGATSMGEGYTHILLIGADVNEYGTSRSDTMMIVSIGKNDVALTSLQRDTGVIIPGKSGYNRLNAAYNYGGPELLLETINLNFGMDIELYAVADYDSFPPLIDLLGGIDISGITDAETAQLNHNVFDILRRRYDSGEMTYAEAEGQYRKEYLTHSGDLHLDGLQALGYARIRKTDSDYTRTLRQRKVITAALGRLKSTRNPVTLVRLLNAAFDSIDTNLTPLQLISLGEKMVFGGALGHVRQTRLPVNGTFTDDGSMFYNVDYRKNHDAFISFVYGGIVP